MRDVGCKACIVRLPDGKLWVHAPVALDDPLRAALAELKIQESPVLCAQYTDCPWTLGYIA